MLTAYLLFKKDLALLLPFGKANETTRSVWLGVNRSELIVNEPGTSCQICHESAFVVWRALVDRACHAGGNDPCIGSYLGDYDAGQVKPSSRFVQDYAVCGDDDV